MKSENGFEEEEAESSENEGVGELGAGMDIDGAEEPTGSTSNKLSSAFPSSPSAWPDDGVGERDAIANR